MSARPRTERFHGLPQGAAELGQFVIHTLRSGGEDSPFREECRTDVDSRNAGPVEKAFGNPVVACGVALGIFPRRNLRHVYNDFERRPLGRVREIRRCRNESRANGIAKISRAGPPARRRRPRIRRP
jgi:hypothetical protein